MRPLSAINKNGGAKRDGNASPLAGRETHLPDGCDGWRKGVWDLYMGPSRAIMESEEHSDQSSQK